MISLNPDYLSRYTAIARLLLKYGRRDIIDQVGLSSLLSETGGEVPEDRPGPQQFARDLEELGPTFIKLGQLLSTRADFLPNEYLSALSRLQDRVEPIDFETARSVIEQELDAKITQAYREFEPRPLATASIGQVHRASLRDGRRVAVKVQRPGIVERIEKDLGAMRELARVLDEHTEIGRRVRFQNIVDTLAETISRELDYRKEAANCRTLAHNLEQFESFVVPQVIEGLSAEKALTMEFIDGAKITDVSRAVLVELDREHMADELFRVYLHQVLVDGAFHADPHPGNLLLTRDYKIALMDFGMVVRVTPKMRLKLVRLLMSIADGRGDETAERAIEIGDPYGRQFDEGQFRQRISNLVAENQGLPLNQLKAGRVVMEINAVAGECGLKLPNAIIMLGKTLMNLDKVVEVLHPEFDPNAALRRHATEIVQQHTRGHFSLARLYDSFLESVEFAELLPERLNKFADLLANNKLRVDVNAIDERKLISGLQKIANRITTGVILAAVIIGASLMMHLETSLTLFGYPAIAMIFFVLAAGAGLVLVWRALFHDESE